MRSFKFVVLAVVSLVVSSVGLVRAQPCVVDCPSGALSWYGYSNPNCAPTESHLGPHGPIGAIPIPSGPIVMEGGCDPNKSCKDNFSAYADYVNNGTIFFYATCSWSGGNGKDWSFNMYTFSDDACTVPYSAWGDDNEFKYGDGDWNKCDSVTHTDRLPQLQSMFRSGAANTSPLQLLVLALASVSAILVTLQ